MQYMGGKTRQGRHIAKQILQHGGGNRAYLEPFLGGGSILALVGHCFPQVTASDIHPDLILMWTALRNGWIPPDKITEDEYEALRAAPPSALRGFVGFGCSFGGKWFGGYARSKVDPRHTNDFCHAAKVSITRKMRGFGSATLLCCDYREHNPGRGTTVYCDPPYRGTQTYGGFTGFDHEEFWLTARKWAADGAVVMVSEYSAPDNVRCVWRNKSLKTLKRGENSEPATENLYLLGESMMQRDLFDQEAMVPGWLY